MAIGTSLVLWYGVHLVLTGNDFPVSYGILPVSQDEHALAVDRVRFVGDPVAAVIARDELTAFDALDLIDVEYAPLRTFATPGDSLAYPEPRIHDYGDEGNIHKLVSLGFGDVDRALSEADEIFEDTFFYEGSTHLPIEQHAAVAARDPDGKLVTTLPAGKRKGINRVQWFMRQKPPKVPPSPNLAPWTPAPPNPPSPRASYAATRVWPPSFCFPS